MKLYNTLSNKLEDVNLNQKKVNIYLCGVTVYEECHIGHARTIIVFDVLKRFLKTNDINVTLIQNFTDIDDKIITRAVKENLTAQHISRKYIERYFKDFDALNVEGATTYPLVTENIKEIIDFVQKLMDKKIAYLGLNGIYFRVNQFPEYGKLSKKNIEEMNSGARIEVDDTKEDPRDFALWKFSTKDPTWPSPWGNGRPGWHIECSAMALKYLGHSIDIHGGGQDLIFPHHENEIAQSEALSGTQFAKIWMHVGMVTIKSEKMSKSIGNTIKISDILTTAGPNVIRLFCLSSHYSKPIDYSDNILLELKNKWRQIANAFHELEFRTRSNMSSSQVEPNNEIDEVELSGYYQEFLKQLENDLNFSLAMTAFYKFINKLNNMLTTNDWLTASFLNNSNETLKQFLNIIGLKIRNVDEAQRIEIEALIEKRNTLRKNKEYNRSDIVRSEIETTYNIELIDHKNFTFWKKRTTDDW